MADKKQEQARQRQIRRQRFVAGLREITIHHRAKIFVPLAYLLALAWAWINRAKILAPITGGNRLVYYSVSLALLLVAFVGPTEKIV